MLSDREIEEQVTYITARLDTLAADRPDLTLSAELAERFRTLREQYQQRPASLQRRVQQLATLSKRFDECMAAQLPLVVDRFHELNEQIRHANSEKELWRDFLIRRATDSRQEHRAGNAAVVRVRSVQARALPSAASAERKRLEDLIRESGQWGQVSQLSGPKLQRALAGNLFDRPQAEAIGQLCPPTVIHQVSSHEPER